MTELLFSLIGRLFQTNKRSCFPLRRAKVHQYGDFVIGQVVQPGFHNQGVIPFDLDSNPLCFLVDRPEDWGYRIGDEVLEVSANSALLAESQLNDLVRVGLSIGDDRKDSQGQPVIA